MTKKKDEIIKRLYEPLYKPKNVEEKKIKSDQLLFNLYKKPKKDKGLNAPHIQPIDDGRTAQADLLFLPNDDGYKYCLVVADVGYPRSVDAEPIKAKTPKDVLQAFKKIAKRRIVIMNNLVFLQVDGGSEFKGVVLEYFNKQGTFIRVGQAGRSNQQALVEYYNGVIGKLLFYRMTAEELNTAVESNEWVDYLKKIIPELNKLAKEQEPRPESGMPTCEGDSCILLEVGDKIRVAYDKPKDIINGKRLHGNFRASDIRWDPTVRTIETVNITPNQPPMYSISGKESVFYTKNQLQQIPPNESKPPVSTQVKHVVEAIIGKKTLKGKVYYLIKWKTLPKENATWEPRFELIKTIPKLIAQFNKKK